MIKKILIATTNPAKLEEIKSALKELKKQKITLLSLNDVRVGEKPKENGKTFKENSIIKAKFYGLLTNLPTIADDGGLIIPYLNNEPGVKSRRWLGYEAEDKELIDYTLLKLKGVKKPYRLAYLETCVTFFHPRGEIDSCFRGDNILICEQEKIKGYIAEKESKRPTNGYPFRALFIVEKYNKYYDELTEEEHKKINHRYKAIKKLLNKIKPLIYFK